eukprot:5957865-Amphidinium_carterae.1
MAATFPQQLLESMAFARWTVGMDGADQMESSPRIQGLAVAQRSKKRPLHQVLVLTVAMVVALETLKVARDSECDVDAVIAGQLLFCLYARARWSDAQRIE